VAVPSGAATFRLYSKANSIINVAAEATVREEMKPGRAICLEAFDINRTNLDRVTKVTRIFRRILGLIPMATLIPRRRRPRLVFVAPAALPTGYSSRQTALAKAMSPRLCPRRPTDGCKASEYLTSVGISYDFQASDTPIHGLRTISTIW
jgi:hypothetical protein